MQGFMAATSIELAGKVSVPVARLTDGTPPKRLGQVAACNCFGCPSSTVAATVGASRAKARTGASLRAGYRRNCGSATVQVDM
jgi:hypothetical protein